MQRNALWLVLPLLAMRGTDATASPDAEPGARIMPGADVGITSYATWTREGGLALTGVRGATVLIERAFVVRFERETLAASIDAEWEPRPGVQRFRLDVTEDGAPLGALELARGDRGLELSARRAGSILEIAITLEIAEEASEELGTLGVQVSSFLG